MLFLTILSYCTIPSIMRYKHGKYDKKTANRIALINSIIVGLLFLIITSATTENSKWSAAPAFFYYFINVAILTTEYNHKSRKDNSKDKIILIILSIIIPVLLVLGYNSYSLPIGIIAFILFLWSAFINSKKSKILNYYLGVLSIISLFYIFATLIITFFDNIDYTYQLIFPAVISLFITIILNIFMIPNKNLTDKKSCIKLNGSNRAKLKCLSCQNEWSEDLLSTDQLNENDELYGIKCPKCEKENIIFIKNLKAVTIVDNKNSNIKIKNPNKKNSIVIIFSITGLLIFSFTFMFILNNKEKATDENCFTISSNGIITSYENSCPKSIVIPSKINEVNVKEIGQNAFEEMDIVSVKFPDGLKKIGKGSFQKNKLTEVVFPDSVTKIYSDSFMANNIKNVKFGKNLNLIGAWSFDFNKIENLVIPDKVVNINYEAFNNNNLKSIVIGKSVEKIEYAVFGQNDGTGFFYESGGNRGLTKIINNSGKSFDWYSVLDFTNTVDGPKLWLESGEVATDFGKITITK